MISVSIKSDLSSLKELLTIKSEFDKIQRDAYSSLLADIIHRIHTEGLNGEGAPIGTYSPEYIKVRSGQFANQEKVSKGKNKGKGRGAGTFTKAKAGNEAKIGTKRPTYNRGTSDKVILSLSRQLESDYTIIETGENQFSIQVKSDLSAKIIERQEENYGGKIYKLTEGEHKKVIDLINAQINNILDAR